MPGGPTRTITAPCPRCGKPRVVKAWGGKGEAIARARACRDCRLTNLNGRRSPVVDGYGHRPPAPAPTPFGPGSPEKVAVMKARALAGVGLFHPADLRWEEGAVGSFPLMGRNEA